ncbi:MAG: DUF2200 family protein [Chloroflexi bacterium]|nr:DUF2200 family protein [Chloroflexota bacterium]
MPPPPVGRSRITGRAWDRTEWVFINAICGLNISGGDTFYLTGGMNPSRALITGVICGIRVENIEEPLMREIRYLDKLVDELAKGKTMEKILRAG